MYEHLKGDYYENLPRYKHLLQPGSPISKKVPKEEIDKYVSQPRDNNGKLTTFDHLPVREVKYEWGAFIYQYKSFILPKEYGLDLDSQRQQNWQNSLKETAKIKSIFFV